MSLTIQCEILAQETPNVLRNCHKCKKTTEFYCSEKFRVNAQQRIIDVWLIYNCLHCDSTWNFPILSRVQVDKINRELYQKFTCNDKETAWEYAFQIEKLRNLCSDVNTSIKYTVIKERFELEMGRVTINLVSKYKFDLRLDKLLAEILGISRSMLCQMAERGRILITPQVSIKGKIKEDLKINIHLEDVG